jgi:hypothetical protein
VNSKKTSASAKTVFRSAALTAFPLVVVLMATALPRIAQAQSSSAEIPQVLPNPALPSGMLGPQLIVWSETRRPQPVPQPLPANQSPPANSQAQPQPTAQTFTGTITKDGDNYVLKASNGAVYQLDNQDEAKQFDGKPVKIVGNLDATSNILHVTSILLIS